jgi:hypothetical protein
MIEFIEEETPTWDAVAINPPVVRGLLSDLSDPEWYRSSAR